MDQAQGISPFGEILLYIVAGALFIVITMMVSRMLRPNRPNAEKLTTYESGEEPITTAWTQFNLRFYIIALVFLLFEVEIVFLFPWSTIFADQALNTQTNGAWGWFVMWEMLFFIGVLALGLAYAWRNGHLNWVKPQPTPTPFTGRVPRGMYDALNIKFKTHQKTGNAGEK